MRMHSESHNLQEVQVTEYRKQTSAMQKIDVSIIAEKEITREMLVQQEKEPVLAI